MYQHNAPPCVFTYFIYFIGNTQITSLKLYVYNKNKNASKYNNT